MSIFLICVLIYKLQRPRQICGNGIHSFFFAQFQAYKAKLDVWKLLTRFRIANHPDAWKAALIRTQEQKQKAVDLAYKLHKYWLILKKYDNLGFIEIMGYRQSIVEFKSSASLTTLIKNGVMTASRDRSAPHSVFTTAADYRPKDEGYTMLRNRLLKYLCNVLEVAEKIPSTHLLRDMSVSEFDERALSHYVKARTWSERYGW